MRRLAVVLVVGVVAFAGCSSGGGKKAASKEAKEAIASAGGDYCELARNLEGLDETLFNTEGPPTEDQIQDLQAVVDAFLRTAPDEIKSDAELLASSLDALIEYLEIVGGDFLADPSSLSEEDQKRVEELSAQFEDPKYQEASDNVDKYNKQECGIDPDADSGEGGETPAPEGEE